MSDIQEYYERYWQSPETYNDPTTPQRQALIRRHLASLPPGSKVLDAGCGRGEFCEFFSSLGHQAEGIDISETGIQFARSQFPNQRFHVGEVQSLLPSRKHDFGCVFSSEVIEHLFDVRSYLLALHELLAPNGKLVLTTPYHGLIKNLAIDVGGYARHYDPMGQHIRFFDTKSLNRCLAEAGFNIDVTAGYGRPWPFWKSFFVVCSPKAIPQSARDLRTV